MLQWKFCVARHLSSVMLLHVMYVMICVARERRWGCFKFELGCVSLASIKMQLKTHLLAACWKYIMQEKQQFISAVPS